MVQLNKSQTELLESLLKGPLPHNALSRDVIALVSRLGSVEEHGHNKLVFTVGEARRSFLRPKDKHMTTEELSELRHFILTTQIANKPPETQESDQSGRISVVVIDHHGARCYSTTGGSEPDFINKAAPADPHGFHRHLIHRKQANYQGDRAPEDPAFYEDIAQMLKDSPAIVIIGHGTGKSNSAAYLVEYLHKKHPDIGARIVGTEVVDLSALTEPQIESLAERQIAGRRRA